jgi:alanine dehydrogenase
MPLLLTEADIKELLAIPDLIAAMEEALAAFSSGQVRQPVRTMFDVGPPGAFFALMPAYVLTPSALGAKLVTVYNSNLARGLTSHLATILLLDPETGGLLSILDGRYITEARTAAVSAVSARKLARPDSRVLAILGSGVQAHSHLEVLSHVLKFDEVRVWSPTRANLVNFAKATGAQAMDSAEAAVRGADVIVLVTASSGPVIENAWVKGGAHVISVGACRPAQREMDPALVLRSRLFVDSRVAAMEESGDVIGAGAGHIVAELGEPAAARKSAEEVTIFKSLGLAVEDVVAAHLAFTRATKLGKGASVTV